VAQVHGCQAAVDVVPCHVLFSIKRVIFGGQNELAVVDFVFHQQTGLETPSSAASVMCDWLGQ
jgi:hypothetical protein